MDLKVCHYQIIETGWFVLMVDNIHLLYFKKEINGPKSTRFNIKDNEIQKLTSEDWTDRLVGFISIYDIE